MIVIRKSLFIKIDAVQGKPCYFSTVASGADHTDSSDCVLIKTQP